MKIGFKALAISANAQLEEDEDGKQEEIGGWMWGLTIALSLALAVGLFFVVPVGLTSLIKDQLGSPLLFWLVEGIVRCLKRWPWERPTWVAWVPSVRPGREALLDALATRIGEIGKLPVHNAVVRRRPGAPQGEQGNAAHKLTNVWGAFAVERSEVPAPEVLAGPVLLVDDVAGG